MVVSHNNLLWCHFNLHWLPSNNKIILFLPDRAPPHINQCIADVQCVFPRTTTRAAERCTTLLLLHPSFYEPSPANRQNNNSPRQYAAIIELFASQALRLVPHFPPLGYFPERIQSIDILTSYTSNFSPTQTLFFILKVQTKKEAAPTAT